MRKNRFITLPPGRNATLHKLSTSTFENSSTKIQTDKKKKILETFLALKAVEF